MANKKEYRQLLQKGDLKYKSSNAYLNEFHIETHDLWFANIWNTETITNIQSQKCVAGKYDQYVEKPVCQNF